MAPKHKKSDGGSRGTPSLRRRRLQAHHRLRQAGGPRPAQGPRRFLLWGLTGSLAIAVGDPALLVGDPPPPADRDRHRAHRRLVLGALLRCRAARCRPWPSSPAGASPPGRDGAKRTPKRAKAKNQLMARAASKGGRITPGRSPGRLLPGAGGGRGHGRAPPPAGSRHRRLRSDWSSSPCAFLAGRRRGRSRSAVVEIRRL